MAVWKKVLLWSDGELLLLGQCTCNRAVEIVKLFLSAERVIGGLWLELVKLRLLVERNLSDLVLDGSLELCLSEGQCGGSIWLFEK